MTTARASAAGGLLAVWYLWVEMLRFDCQQHRFGAAVIAADALSELPPPAPSTPNLGAAAPAKPPVLESYLVICGSKQELLFRAYSCTDQGLAPPAVEVRRCSDGRGWGLFALANFAAGDVLFIEAPMYCTANPETRSLHCNNCMRSFCPPLPQLPHRHLWTSEVHISCSRGGDCCSAVYCNSFCRCHGPLLVLRSIVNVYVSCHLQSLPPPPPKLPGKLHGAATTATCAAPLPKARL